MVRINSLALAGLAALGASAQDCMTADEAQSVATNFGNLIANYSDSLANSALAVNFTDYSESVNTLINTCPQGSAAITLPLLSPTFSSRAQFELGQSQQPPINFQQLAIFPSCTSVTIRWITTNTAPIPSPKPVVGLINMQVVRNPDSSAAASYPWIIDTVFSEFDSGAWLQNLQEAGICGTPPANSSAINDPTTANKGSSSGSGSSLVAPAPAATCSCPAPAPVGPSPTKPVATSVPTPYSSGNGTATAYKPSGTGYAPSSTPVKPAPPMYTGAANKLSFGFAGFAVLAGLAAAL